MSNFQSNFMQTAESARNANLEIVERYKADSHAVVEDLFREMTELQHIKAHMVELQDRSRLRLFFDRLADKFNNGLKKYTLDFTEEAKETYHSYDKRLRNLFTAEGVSGRDIYHNIDDNSETMYSVFEARANNIRLETNLLEDIELQIFDQSEKIIKKAGRRKKIWGIIVPTILIIAAIASSMAVKKIVEDKAQAALKENVSNILTGLGTDEQLTGSVTDIGIDKVTSAVGAVKDAGGVLANAITYVVTAFVVIAVWLIYYTIFAYMVKKQMIGELERTIPNIMCGFSGRKAELQEAYGEWLTTHLNEMNAKYFMKYKPLIDLMISKGSK